MRFAARPRRLRAMATVASCALALVVGTVAASADAGRPAANTGKQTAATDVQRPNIVFVLTDDLSWNLVRYMPHVHALQTRGMTFDNYTVTDSLCCPSRTSILTGEFPHNSLVFGNTLADDGGFQKFQSTGDDQHIFALDLQKAGVDTGFAGKYINLYSPYTDTDGTVPNQPGWQSWGGVNGGGYNEYEYAIALDHQRVSTTGKDPKNYLTDVLTRFGSQFVTDAAQGDKPFMLELASFAPHEPYVPAPRDVGSFEGLQAPRTPAYGVTPKNAPAWLAARTPLTTADKQALNRKFEKRVESVQDVDRMIGTLEKDLAAVGQLDNTVFVFSSDNGFHMGEHKLLAGKQTAFDTDVNVPLIVAGPGIPENVINYKVVENIDLAPTFDELEGAPIPANVDGQSLVPLLHGQKPAWRALAGIEHVKPVDGTGDPDHQVPADGTPPTYDELRSRTWTYVQYADGEHEFYDRTKDPYELDNTYDSLSTARKNRLTAKVAALSTCVGQKQCWAAAQPTS
jgi:N-acetylglucosamine-6-sulfatase